MPVEGVLNPNNFADASGRYRRMYVLSWGIDQAGTFTYEESIWSRLLTMTISKRKQALQSVVLPALPCVLSFLCRKQSRTKSDGLFGTTDKVVLGEFIQRNKIG